MLTSVLPSLPVAAGPSGQIGGAVTPVQVELPEFAKFIQVNNFKFDPLAESPNVPAALSYDQPAPGQKSYYIVQFKGPITEAMKSALSATSLDLLQYVNYNGFIVSGDGPSIEKARALSFVRWAGLFEPAYKLSPRLSEDYAQILANAEARETQGRPSLSSSSDSDAFSDSVQDSLAPSRRDGKMATVVEASQAVAEASTIDVLITTFDSSWVDEVSDSVFGLGGNEIMVSYKMWGTVRAVVDRGVLAEIARLPGVMWIDKQSDPHVFNDIARWVIQSGNASSFATPIHNHGIYGTGQIVTLADTGIDYDHAAFYDATHPTPGPGHRKVTNYYIPAGGWGDNTDNGINHGSHTAGTIGGDDGDWHSYDGNPTGSNGSAGPHDGQAFDATLQMQDLSTDGYGIGTPSDMHDLFQPALDNNSWIHSNSWGSYGSEYIIEAAQTDDFLWDNQEFIVCFAAGNNGPYTGSISPFSAAKNVIAVGATENGNLMEGVTDFSSRGPCADGRLKPDVMAPGDYIWSVQGMDPSATTNSYWQLSGTSMATPTVAGAATLIRQYFMDGFYPTGTREPSSGFTPSAALVKAMLINSAAEMSGTGAYDNGEYRYPNNNQGWGRVLLDDAMFFQGDLRSLFLEDNRAGIITGSSVSYDLAIGDPFMPVEITLVWTDYPGAPMSSPALVNDLNLVVVDPSGDVFYGNAYAGYNPGQSIKNPNGSAVDHLNNVESVLVVTSPEPGLWTVTVSGYNVPNGPQPYAIVMTGGVATDRGMVGLDKPVYRSSSVANVRVIDLGLNADPGLIETAVVNMTSSTETVPEVLVLTETGAATGVFSGSIQFESSVVPVIGDGILQVLNGDNVTADYFDADNGLGGSGFAYAHAIVDDDPPIISSVTISNIRFNRATVSWQTNEYSDSVVVFGSSLPPATSVTDSSMSTSHEIDLRSLEQETAYYLYVTSTDVAGNEAVDNNSGVYYSFTTGSRPPAPPANIEWPTFHNNMARVGISPAFFSPPLEQVWQSEQIFETYWSGPVEADGMVFSTITDGGVRARDAYTGELVWQRMLGGQYFYTAEPTVYEGVVYAVLDNAPGASGSTLYALDEHTGADLWSIPPAVSPDLTARTPLVAADGLVFGGAWTGEVYSVNISTHQIEWTYSTGDAIYGGIAIDSGQVIAVNLLGTVYCLDEFTGALIWSTNIGVQSITTPMVAMGLVYIGGLSNGLFCLDEVDGTILWNNPSVGPIAFSTPAFDGAAVYLGNDNGQVFALDAFDGSTLWSMSVNGWIESAVAYANGYVYLTASDGLLYVIDSADGSVVESFSIGPYSISSPAVSDGWVWAEDGYGSITAFFGIMPVAVRVSPSSQAMEVVPGMEAYFAVSVTNMGASGPDLFDMNVTLGTNGWPVELLLSDGLTPVPDTDADGLPDTGWLATDANVSIVIRVSVPGDASASQVEESIVNFISENEHNVSRPAKVTCKVPPPGVAIGPRSYFPVIPGETVVAALTVHNTGAFEDIFDIAGNSDNGWTVALFEEDGVTPLTDSDGDAIPDTGVVAPLGSVGIVVQVQVPVGTLMGTVDRTEVKAVSSLDLGAYDVCMILLEFAAPPNDDWPTFHNNNARVGMSPCKFVPPLDLEWVAGPFDDAIFNGPVVADGILFTTGVEGYIRAFDAFTGNPLWSRSLGGYGYYSDTPTVSDGVVYVPFYGSMLGRVYALDETTGDTLWSVGSETGLDFSARAPLAVSSGLVIGAAWDSTVYALDASDGSVEWTYELGGTLIGGAAVAAGAVFVGNDLGQVYALDEMTGSLLWSRSVSGDLLGGPMSAQGRVFVATYYGVVYALDALNGNVTWVSSGLGSFMYVTPAYDGTSIYVGSATGVIYRLDISDGSVIWSTYISEYITSSVACANGYVYVSCGNGSLLSLNATTGAIVDVDMLYSWESTSSVALSDGWVWTQDMAGYVYAFQGLVPVGLRVQPIYSEIEAVPSSTVDHYITVTNIGVLGSDVFDVTVTAGVEGWAVELLKASDSSPLPDTDSDGVPDTGPVAFQGSMEVIARVTVPATAWPGDVENTGVRFTSSNDETIYRDAVAATLIPPPGATLGPNAYKYSSAGAAVVFEVTLLNTGALPDVFDMTLSQSLAWTVALYQFDGVTPLSDSDSDGIVDTGELAGLATFSMVVNVTVPSDANASSICMVILRASSSIDPNEGSSAKLGVEVIGAQSTDWPTYQHDNKRSGVAPEDYSLPLTHAWTYSGTGGASYGTSPSVAGGIVYYTSTSGFLMAVDAVSGEEVWSNHLGGDQNVMSTPTVYNGKVYVTYITGGYSYFYLAALNALNGEVVWQAGLVSDASFSVPLAAAGAVYLGDDYGRFYAFDADTGAKLWERVLQGSVHMGPCLVEDMLVVGTSSGTVYAFSLDGAPRWSTLVTGTIYGAPSSGMGMVYVGTSAGYVYGLNSTDGTVIWSRDVGEPIYYSTPVIWGAAVYVVDYYGGVHCMDALTGTEIWTKWIDDYVPISSIVNNGTLYVPSTNGTISLFDCLTGALKDTLSVSFDMIESPPAIAKGYMYVIDDSGVLRAYAFEGAGVAETISVTPPSAVVTVGGFELFIVEGFDRYGNPAPSQQYGWTFAEGTGTIVLTTENADECLFIASTEVGHVVLRVSGGAASFDILIEVIAGPIVMVEVTPAKASANVTADIEFTAVAYDGFGNEVTGEQVQWNTTIGTMGDDGVLHTGTVAGVGTVTATINGVNSSAEVTVTPGEPDHLAVDPTSISLTVGSMAALEARCYDQYGNEINGLAYEWSSSVGSVSTMWESYSAVLLAGTVSGTGSVTVSCAGLSLQVPVTVTPGPVASIELWPDAVLVPVGESHTFEATCYDVYGNEVPGADVTFTVNGEVGSIDGSGVFSAGTVQGVCSVKATVGSVAAEASVVVAPGALHHIGVDSSSVTVVAGGVASLNATCFDEYGNEIPGITLSWSPSAGTVSSSEGHAIYHAGTAVGSSAITVGSGAVSTVVNVTIVHAALDRLVVAPVSIGLVSGESAQLEVKGYDAFGNEVDGLVFEWSFIASATDGATGTVSPGVDDSIATFVADGAGTGLITVVSSGESTTVQVTVDAKTSSISTYGPPIAIAMLLLVVVALLAMYFLVWKKKMNPPSQ